MRILLSIVIIFFLEPESFAQGGFRARCFSQGAITHVTKDVFEISPDKYFAGGISIDGNGVYALTLMGLNGSGQIQWTKKYGTTNLQYGNHPFNYRTFYKRDNYFFYAGAMIDSNQQIIGTLLKLDTIGNIVWQRFYRDSGMDVVPNILTGSTDSGFLLTGFFQSQTTTPTLLIKTDANGNELWRKIINKALPNVSDGRAILQDSASKKIIIAGNQYIGNQNSAATYNSLIILDSLGTTLSHINFNATGGLMDLIQTRDKKFVVTGATRSSDGFNNYYTSYARKFDVNQPNTPLWTIYGFDKVSQLNWFSSVMEFSNGDLLLAGSTDSLLEIDNRHNNLSRFVRINHTTGKVIWKKYYDYAANDSINNNILITCVNPTSDGGWITSLRKTDPGNNPMFYVKYDSTGCDTTTAYCLNLTGLNKINKENESITVYPNPTNGLLNLNFPIDFSSIKKISIRILNIAGAELINKTITTSDFKESTFKLDLETFENGIYFLEVFNDGKHITTRKIIKE
ncbi:T9SS type A sorting domain-containing protein [Aurantibacillus circumpalustris]|uniref:T9SS type A sorting domain-containing protein n=1 Tax=Aurantibacillus circumpalustris TaxID=3036359 RepID=UPI00295A88F4|nr:T9SS type A sorting domain-containing protein [Aurantibacillus circumpalustris]